MATTKKANQATRQYQHQEPNHQQPLPDLSGRWKIVRHNNVINPLTGELEYHFSEDITSYHAEATAQEFLTRINKVLKKYGLTSARRYEVVDTTATGQQHPEKDLEVEF